MKNFKLVFANLHTSIWVLLFCNLFLCIGWFSWSYFISTYFSFLFIYDNNLWHCDIVIEIINYSNSFLSLMLFFTTKFKNQNSETHGAKYHFLSSASTLNTIILALKKTLVTSNVKDPYLNLFLARYLVPWNSGIFVIPIKQKLRYDVFNVIFLTNCYEKQSNAQRVHRFSLLLSLHSSNDQMIQQSDGLIMQ